jgi:flagellar hook-basal body complex protein FliE
MIGQIPGITPIPSPASAFSSAGGSGGGSFQSVLQSTIKDLQSQQDDAGAAVQKFLSGESEDVHTVALATQKAELAFELGLQVRNKVVSAYQEIMKMQL